MKAMAVKDKRTRRAKKLAKPIGLAHAAATSAHGGASRSSVQASSPSKTKTKPAPSVFEQNIAAVLARAIKIFGDEQKALHWMESPVGALGRTTPLAVLDKDNGFVRVNDVLTQIEHGVW
jgi:Antitoxin Xre/MbcA/ParS C-terminal toxin-binding domain